MLTKIKKTVSFMLIFAVMLSLSGCSNAKAMQIKKAELTKQEQQINKLIKTDNSFIWDFALDKPDCTVTINSYGLDKEGAWQLIGGDGAVTLNGKNGRIAINYDKIPNGLKTTVQDNKETSSSKFEIVSKIDFSDTPTTVITYAEAATAIEYEKEIPIAIQIISSQSAIRNSGVELYYTPEEYTKAGHEHVYAVTVKFS